MGFEREADPKLIKFAHTEALVKRTVWDSGW
ncbi:hypothetical protein MTTB_03230 [Methanothermobacter tenebrarum]|uniref:Uncharacterized protein n=1 Tax=Methanothermobacter tenebrarum TaxID=680118 RepID=A0ABN6P9V8_9EURY|nr:hypothetical protein MTTB_03230 [Methanothermobacter tenebrarum]